MFTFGTLPWDGEVHWGDAIFFGVHQGQHDSAFKGTGGYLLVFLAARCVKYIPMVYFFLSKNTH